MIVRDEEDNLSNCLESVRGLFDEIVVVDTGSVDRTKEIAREFGAKVFDFVWIDDFAAARNEALSHATGDYAFWLDADDVIEPDEREKLRALLVGLARPVQRPALVALGAGLPTPPLATAMAAGLPTPPLEGPEVCPARTEPRPPGENGVAYVVRCACAPSPDGSKGETVVDHVRLFPLRPGVRWVYRVHEQILPSLNRLKVPVRWTDLIVRHTGYLDPAVEARKLERNIKILKRELEERPGEPFVLFNLGAAAVEKCEWHDALDFLGRSLAGSAPTDLIVCKLDALIARVHQMMGNSQEALRTCALGFRAVPIRG
jgi:glycosyltransferase involved in cell wall biosynthesis